MTMSGEKNFEYMFLNLCHSLYAWNFIVLHKTSKHISFNPKSKKTKKAMSGKIAKVEKEKSTVWRAINEFMKTNQMYINLN